MQTQNKLVGICQALEPLKPSQYNANEIRVSIGQLEENKTTPRNFRRDSDTPRNSTGGMHARIFASEYGTGVNANLFSSYGPDVTYGQIEDYEHAARACKVVQKNESKFYATRGNSIDAAEAMGRFLEATGVEKVFLRPSSHQRESWLDRGEWLELTVGDFVNRVRANLYAGKAVEVAA